MKLSVALISFNEEANIRRTLEAVRGIADEIVMVDSFSTDNTVSIARDEFGARVHQLPWSGYIAQKNACLEHCRGEWILSLDCDETVEPDLLAAIRNVLDLPSPAAGYMLRRRSHYMGTPMRRAWQPDRKLRLVRRDANPRWMGSDPHETLRIDGAVKCLPGRLTHYSFPSFDAHMEKARRMARQVAACYFREGRKSGYASLLLRPPFRFFRHYLLHGAILDGTPGLMASLGSAVYVYMKYAYLWELQQNQSLK